MEESPALLSSLGAVLDEIDATTSAGRPEGCEAFSIFALDSFSRCLGFHLPAEYRSLLAEVNGLTLPRSLKIFGVGIPIMDEHQRLDFVIANVQPGAITRILPVPPTTRYGLFADGTELIFNGRRQTFEFRAPGSESPIATFGTFLEMLSTALLAASSDSAAA